MKMITLLFAVLLSTSTFAQTKFSECYNYAMATGNVYEDKFTVVVNNKEVTEAESASVEKILFSKPFEVIKISESNSRTYLTVKADLVDMYNIENSLEFLNNQENIQVNCKYIL